MALEKLDQKLENNFKAARFPIAWALFTLALAIAPFIWAYLVTPPNTRFMGALWNVPDVNAYLSRIEWGRRGEWLLQLTYTSEEQQSFFFHFFYILLGKLAGLLNLPGIFIFHLARLVAGYFLLYSSWRFICRLFSEPSQRKIAFWLVCFGSGLGWLVSFFGLKDSTDLWVAEGQTFFTILAMPHYAVASSLLILGFLALLDSVEGPKAGQHYAKIALVGLLLSAIHPFLVITLGAVSGLYLLRLCLNERKIRLRDWLGLIIVGLVSLPLPIYTFWVTSSDPIYSEWSKQNQTLSPNPIFYILGYGLLLALALPGAWWAERYAENRQQWQLVTTWVATTALLLYVPLSFQRRLIEGVHLPIVLLATAGFFFLTKAWKPVVQGRRAKLLVIFTSLSTLLVLTIFVSNIYARESEGSIRPLHLYTDEIRILNWLRANTELKDTVIAGPLVGSYIPAFAGNRVFYGHDLETIRRDEKIQLLNRFFRFEMSPTEMQEFIRKYNIKYVFWGPDEAKLFASRAAAENESLPFLALQERGWKLRADAGLAKLYQVS